MDHYIDVGHYAIYGSMAHWRVVIVQARSSTWLHIGVCIQCLFVVCVSDLPVSISPQVGNGVAMSPINTEVFPKFSLNKSI